MRTAKLFFHTLVAVSMVLYTISAALLASPLTASAAQTVGLPSSIGYQGRLKTSAGVAVSDAARTFVFQFCDASATTSTCSGPLGSAITQSLSTVNGYFSTSLSTSSVSSYFAVGNLYLQITVAGEIMNPTVQVLASPYAMTTRSVEQLPVASEPATGGQTGYAGRVYYDTTNNLFKYYDAGATAWVAVAATENGATLTVDNSSATAVNIGTTAVARTITMGNGTGGTSLVLNAGTGALNIGTNAIAHTTTVGNTTGASAVQINTGSGGFGVDGPEFDITPSTGAITINDSGDAGSLTVEGTNLDINSLDFVGVGSVTSATASNLNISSGTTGVLTLDSATTGNVNVGTSSFAKQVSVGNETGGSALILHAGSGGVAVETATNGAISVTTSGSGTLSLDTGGTGTINLGTIAAAKTINVGNDTGATALNVKSGSGGITLDADGVAASGITLDAYSAGVNTTGDITMDSRYLLSTTHAAANTDTSVNISSSLGKMNLATTDGAISLTADGGTGSMSLNANQDIGINTQSANRTISIGTSAFDKSIVVGGVNSETISIDSDGTASDTVNISTGGGTNAVNIGTGTGVDTIAVGTSAAAADGITVGNSNVSTTLVLTGGDDWSVAGTGTASFNPSAAPVADIMTITTGVGGASATSGVDGLNVTFSGTNNGDAVHVVPSFSSTATAKTYNGIELDAFTATNTTGTDIVNGMKIGNLTEAGIGAVTSTGLSIGSGWDVGLAMGSNLDMQNNLILNIGDAGTDFTAGGGLNLTGKLTTADSISLSKAVTDTATPTTAQLLVRLSNPAEGGADTGIYTRGDGQLDFASNGTESGELNQNGLLLPAGNGVDTLTAGALTFGNTTATSASICNSAACDTLSLANNADADTINLGDSLDTNVIAGAAASSITLGSVFTVATVTGNTHTSGTLDADGSANISDTTAEADVTMGNSTGNLTFASDNADFTLTDATDNVFQLVNGTNSRLYLDIDAGAADTVTLGNTTDITLVNGSASSAIDFGNFDVATSGNITVAAAQGLDTNGAGALAIGNSNATSASICNSAACDTLSLANNADADTINLGDSLDTNVIAGAAASSITLGSVFTVATVTGNTHTSGTLDADGSANISDTTAEADVTMGNSTGNLTFASDNADFTLTDATDNVFQLVNGTNSRLYLDIDAGAADTVTLGNTTDITLVNGSASSAIDFGNFDVATSGNITVAAAQGLDTNGAGALKLGQANATSITFGVSAANEATLDASSFSPQANAGNALGTTALGWNGLNLSTGTAINFANGEVTLTETDANTLTLAGGSLSVGANSIVGTTGLIDYTNFGVNAAGQVAVSAPATVTVGTSFFSGAFGAATTQTGNLGGVSVDMKTNYTPLHGVGTTGITLRSPVISMTADQNDTTTFTGIGLTTGGGFIGAVTLDDTTANLFWTGMGVNLPATTQTNGTLVVDAFNGTNGTMTTGGTQNIFHVGSGTTTLTAPAAGTLNGLNINSITAAAGSTETAINIGAGWDTGISLALGTTSTSSQALVVTSGNMLRTTNLVDLTESGTASGNMVDLNFGATASTGDAVNVSMGSTNIAGGAFVVADADGARTDAILDISSASTGDGNDASAIAQINASGILLANSNVLDVNVSAASASNAFDVTYSAASTGNAVDLNMANNVAGDAVNIATANTTGNALDITASGIFTNELIDINTSANWTGNLLDITTGNNAWTGNVIDINFGDAAATGDVINIANPALAVATQMMVVTNAAASSTDGWLMKTSTSGAWTGNAIDADIGAGVSTGNFIDVTYGTAGHTGNAIDLNMGTNVAGDAININSASTSGNALDITDTSSDNASSMVTITGTDATVDAQTYLLRGTYSADGDPEADFLLFEDNNGDAKFVIQENGATTITGVADGTGALTLTAGDLTLTDGDLVVSAGDVNFTTDAADTVNIAKGGAASADVMLIAAGAVADSAGVDGLAITLTAADNTDRTNALINGALISQGTAVTDVGIGLLLDLSSVADATSTNKAIKIANSAAWDRDIEFQNAEFIDNATNGTIKFSGSTNADVAEILDAATTAVVADFNGGIQFNAAATASTQRLCASSGGGDALALTNVSIVDCSDAGQADFAEMYPVAQGITYGDIVVPGSTEIVTKNGDHIVQLVKSADVYQGPVSGIVSNNYEDGTVAGHNVNASDNPMPVALVGRVPVNVTDEGGAIAVGDFITTSSTAGKGMKATQAGRVIGMALSTVNANGQVMVQVVNTWYQPATSLQGGSAVAATTLSGDVSLANATFSGSVTVAEHLYGSHDMAGRVRLASGKSKVHVTFEKAYTALPIVTFSSRSNSASAEGAWVSDEDVNGFNINRSVTDSQVEFNWIAIGVSDAQVTVSDDNSDGTAVSVTDSNGPAAPAPVAPAPAEAPAPVAPAADAPAADAAPATDVAPAAAEQPAPDAAPAPEAPAPEVAPVTE